MFLRRAILRVLLPSDASATDMDAAFRPARRLTRPVDEVSLWVRARKAGRRMRTNDTVAGGVIIALAMLIMALTVNFPPFPGQKYGPSLFPRLLGAGLVLCGALLIWRDRRSVARPAALALAPWTGDRWRIVSFALVLAVPLVSLLAWDRIGFVPVAFVSLLVMFLWFRTRPATALAAAVIATALLQLFFGKLMRVPLPPGWLLYLPPHWLKYFM
jgi:putative tricarboxylic transport membrane protein